jgi:DNA-binding protein Fis
MPPEKMSEKEVFSDDLNLSQLLEKKFSAFLRKVKHSNPKNLYDLLISECEKPLFALVLKETDGNQVKAAKMLGVTRNTLRKKIEMFKIKIQKGKKNSGQ